MLAESVHSFADSSNQLLLLVGLIRSGKPATVRHPFGYSVERYFWSFVVAMNIFVLGAAVSIYEGVNKILHPHALGDLTWSYIALGVGAVFEAFALRVAWGEFKHFRVGQKTSLWRSMREAKDLSLPTVLFEDTAALVGLAIAALGIGLAQWTGEARFDGAASVLIGLVLLGVAWFLGTESHSLLIGEAATSQARSAIATVVKADPAVRRVVGLTTLQRGPNAILVGLELEFTDGMSTDEIEGAIRRLEAGIQREVPAAKHIFIEAGAFHRADGDHSPEWHST